MSDDTLFTGKYGEIVRIERTESQAEKCSRGEHERDDMKMDVLSYKGFNGEQVWTAHFCQHCRCLYVEPSK